MPAPIRLPTSDSLNGLDTLASSDAATDSCADSNPAITPLFRMHFSRRSEASGSACARTGWGPRHLLARLDGAIAGIVPCYLKSHSQGEYVFDRGWADAYERAGGRYYPKLQASVPFTPATGPRLLIRDGVDARPDRRRAGERAGGAVRCHQGLIGSRHLCARGRMEVSGRARLPAAHRPAVSLAQSGLCAVSRTFSPPSIRATARRSSASGATRWPSGITIHALTGSDITEDAWDAFFAFYMETGSRKWGRPYLTRAFFSLIGESMAKDVLLVMARRNGRWIAGAINFIGSDTLVRPQLGRDRASSVSAFRGLLLPGDRFCDRARPENGRGRRARRAQDRARISAANHLFRALHRRSRPAPRDIGLSQARARLCGGGRRANSPRPGRSAKPPTSRLDRTGRASKQP